VVRCNSCMTEYRLNEALLKGAKGACIRCPKCRERIFVENPPATPAAPPIGRIIPPPIASPVPLRVAPPLASRPVPWLTPPAVPPQMPSVAPPAASPPSPPKVPPTLPPPAAETSTPPIRVAAPEVMISAVPRGGNAGGADLSGMIRPDPEAEVDDAIDVSPTPIAISASIISRGKALRPEELIIHPSVEEGDRIQSVQGGGEDDPLVIRLLGPRWNPPPRRPLYRRPLFRAAMISILLLAGGAFYFVDGNSAQTSSGNINPARARSAPEKAVFDVGNLKGYLNSQTSGKPLYIVKGTVTNVGNTLSSGIRIEATLLGKDNNAIVKNGSFAGNVIDESLISNMSRERIERILGMRYGELDVNRQIPAGKTLQFMVVFFDPPEAVESFRVKTIDADERDRVGSPDWKDPGSRVSNQQPIRLN